MASKHKGRKHRGAAQRKHIATKAARRQTRKAKLAAERAKEHAVTPRMQAKAAARETAIDQVTLDKLNGLEDGRICRAHYKKLCARERPPVARQRRKGKPRAAATYRYARRDMVLRRLQQRRRHTRTAAVGARSYNLTREMARRVRQAGRGQAIRMAA